MTEASCYLADPSNPYFTFPGIARHRLGSRMQGGSIAWIFSTFGTGTPQTVRKNLWNLKNLLSLFMLWHSKADQGFLIPSQL